MLGVSYGAYLAVLLSGQRPVESLLLRSPAIYQDEGWDVQKEDLDRNEVEEVRDRELAPPDNRALTAAAQFEGDLTLVECEDDKVIPHETHMNYFHAFSHARSRQLHLIAGAGHELSGQAHRKCFEKLFESWLAGRSTQV